jgi:hypothetical protein
MEHNGKFNSMRLFYDYVSTANEMQRQSRQKEDNGIPALSREGLKKYKNPQASLNNLRINRYI